MTLKVLLVDDEALARSRLRTLLGDCTAPAALVAAEASNSVEAMRALAHDSFDVVLLDIGMPGVDGLSMAGAIAALPRPPAVIFVTAHSEHAVQAFELAAADYLTKPVRLERLQLALQKVERSAIATRGAAPEATPDVRAPSADKAKPRGSWPTATVPATFSHGGRTSSTVSEPDRNGRFYR